MERPVEDFELMQANGEAIRRLMAEPVVKQLFEELVMRYFKRWLASTSVEERELIHADARALSALSTEFQAVIDAGTIATRELER